MIKKWVGFSFWGLQIRSFLLAGSLLILISSCQSKKVEFLKTGAIQLAPPKIEVDSLLFIETAHVKLYSGSDEVDIRYTLDGSEVTSNSLSYTEPVTVSSTTNLKVKAFHPDFNASEVVDRTIIKMAKDISGATISIQPEAHASYKALGPNTLIDRRKGEFNFRSGNRWLGFQTNETVVNLEFSEAIFMEKALVGLLQDHGSWIFLPEAIEIQASDKTIGQLKLKPAENGDRKKMGFMEITVEKGEYNQITIIIHALQGIPEWHPGKGTMPWTFVDEILIE
ncbi:chitobiase/beta-hexosaminidase C-terminal domain-containing protein [Flagellimonas sp. 2504JD1-5]